MISSSEDQIMLKNPSWWKRRSRLELSLVVAVTLLAVLATTVLAIYLVSLKKKELHESPNDEEELLKNEICYTPACIHTSSNIVSCMDNSIDPCDDFYQFACGGFIKETIIPDDKTSIDSSLTINEAVAEQLKVIVQEPINHKEPKPFKLFKRMYSICMNTTAIENDGYDTLLNSIVDTLGGWPVLDGRDWNHGEFDWKDFIYKSRQLGSEANLFLSVLVEADSKQSSRRIITLFQPWLEFSKEQFAKGLKEELIKTYYEYMVDLVLIFSINDDSKEFIQNEMMDVLKFEMELSKNTLSKQEMRNITNLYNPMTVGELQLKYLDIPWLEFLNNMISLTNDNITENDMVDVNVPNYIKKLLILLNRTPKRTLANYAMFNIVTSLVPYLTEEVRDLNQQYSEKISGTRTRQPRWKECVTTAAYTFQHASGAIYIRNYFNKNAKGNVEEMASDIHSEFNNTLEQTAWMDETTRSKALEKTAAIRFSIAYAEELLDNKKLEEFYSEVDIDTNNYLSFVLKMDLFSYNRYYNRLRQPVKNDWTIRSSPIVVNAMYFPEQNSIYLPAGILQGVFFNADRPRYMNYGAIGYVIGHEITHGFDDIGRQFDKDGNMEDWWAEDTKKAYLSRAKCIIDQYGKLTVPELKIKLDGINTQGENIADNGGIKLAYSAYQAWVERNEPEKLLPGLNYTQNQMFWISAANSWCSKIRKETLKLDVSESPHSPPKFRVNVPFSNTEFFAKDFDCPVGSKMNPKKKCTVW